MQLQAQVTCGDRALEDYRGGCFAEDAGTVITNRQKPAHLTLDERGNRLMGTLNGRVRNWSLVFTEMDMEAKLTI